MDTSPKSEPTLELHSRAAPSVEAHHHVSSPNTGRNSGGRWIKKLKFKIKIQVGLLCGRALSVESCLFGDPNSNIDQSNIKNLILDFKLGCILGKSWTY